MRHYAALEDNKTGDIIKISSRPCRDFYNAQTQAEVMLRKYKGSATATVIAKAKGGA